PGPRMPALGCAMWRLTTNSLEAAKRRTVARLKAETSSPGSAQDCPADLAKCGSPKKGSLIAIDRIDQIFNDARIKELAAILKLKTSGGDQFAKSIRNDVRLFIEAKGRLNNTGLQEATRKLYQLTTRAEGNDRAASSLVRAIDAMPSDVWDWLGSCNPE